MNAMTKGRKGLDIRRLLSTRGGTLAVAGFVAAVAALLLLVFLDQYRDNVKGGTATTSVLVANRLIEKGSSGDVIASQKMFETVPRREDELEQGAVADPAVLKQAVAARDIYPGEQLTRASFVAGGATLQAKLTKNQRAIRIPFDAVSGMIGDVQSGDRVDIIGGFNGNSGGQARPVITPVMRNVLVLSAPGAAADGQPAQDGSSLVFRVTDRQAAALAFAADNGKLRILLRPQVGAQDSRPSTVDLESLMSGLPQIAIDEDTP